ncbi:amidase [Stappia sp. 22II-S9-Z10]|nr:amidase [Stappia sp. 22II-S9-Z10]
MTAQDVDRPVRAATLLNVKGLRAGYGRVPVLHGVDVWVGEGEIVGILGHNGMGKTTLLKTLMGLVPATGGSVHFDGMDITREKSHARSRLGMGYVPQGRGIFPMLSVRDNLRMGIAAHGSADESAAIDAMLAEFPQLERLLDRAGGALSGGEQQLLALARCLVSGPELLLLDEPTEGIQPSIVDMIEDKLRELAKVRGLSILLVEQNLEFITDLSDKLVLLNKGQVAGVIDRADFKDAPLIAEFTGLNAKGGRAAPKPTAPKPAAPKPATASAPKPAAPKTAAPDLFRPEPVQRHARMTVQRPSLAQMKAITEDFGMHLSDERLKEFMALMEASIKTYDILDAMPDNLPEVLFPRTSGHRPAPEDNPYNAWYVKTDIKGAPRGPLAGKTVALKDNVCLAGVPMMNGASTLKGYVPDVDATIVTWMLEAGATIKGKAHCEYFCFSGGSHTNATGPVQNPRKMGHTTGGSSSGSGALVAAGEVDIAIGGDQGGSIRMPASFCGIYGMKPTHGLVPYSGVMPIETTIDHTGPMTANVHDNALCLEVIAGKDGLDPRQYAPKVDAYRAALGRGVRGMRMALVREGFGRPESEQVVDASVRKAADLFRKLGATVDEVSIPWHAKAMAVWLPIAAEGGTNQMMRGNGMGTGWKGLHTTSLLDYHANWRSRADELADPLKITMFVGEYFQRFHRGHYYAKAQNQARNLRAAYDNMLASYDILIMPTTPMRAPPIPPADAPLGLVVQRAFEMIENTAPFDITGHPSMSIPCGMEDELPVGMMLTAKHWGESTIYQAAAAFEGAGDWTAMRV